VCIPIEPCAVERVEGAKGRSAGLRVDRGLPLIYCLGGVTHGVPEQTMLLLRHTGMTIADAEQRRRVD
jgi:hypothetical protein